ncbi:hypothetical protein C2E23DRAFT_801709 [Lenzites betulinus]|nr:hypothetical protein C2E23DRAFT_801709 [Lenzites betulinus]
MDSLALSTLLLLWATSGHLIFPGALSRVRAVSQNGTLAAARSLVASGGLRACGILHAPSCADSLDYPRDWVPRRGIRVPQRQTLTDLDPAATIRMPSAALGEHGAKFVRRTLASRRADDTQA